MTPTTTERDRFEAWAKDTMSLVKEPGGYKEATTHHAWRAWQAAITREQREVPPGLYDLDPYVLPQQEAPSEQREGVTDEMVARFLGWKLPADFAPDCGIKFEPVGNKGTRFEYRFEPVGTNLLTAIQARAMLEYVLAAGAPTAQQPLDDEANNAGVATGSRNSSPSESVTRGNLPPSIPQQEAPAITQCPKCDCWFEPPGTPTSLPNGSLLKSMTVQQEAPGAVAVALAQFRPMVEFYKAWAELGVVVEKFGPIPMRKSPEEYAARIAKCDRLLAAIDGESA